MSTDSSSSSLRMALLRLAELQREPINRLALQEAVTAAENNNPQNNNPQEQLRILATHLGLNPPRWLKAADASQVPALLWDNQWRVLVGKNGQDQWITQSWNEESRTWSEENSFDLTNVKLVRLSLRPIFRLGNSPIFALVTHEMRAHRRLLMEAGVAGLIIGLLGLITSFYSLQVYDRVIPTAALQTLMVLSLGALVAVGLDWLARHSRSYLYEHLIESVDQRLARTVYLRLLSIRLDQFPRSVGSLAGQMRGYESVRAFLTQATTSMLVDLPFAILFLALIAVIGGWLALVPVSFFLMAFTLALSSRGSMEVVAHTGMRAGNFKTGLLVETVEGAETIKSGQGGWRLLGRWLKSTEEARDAEIAMRRISERFQHLIASFQQFSYILLVALGAWRVSEGEMTMGGLIACSILSGRVLNPVTILASQMMQWSQAKAALEGLDALWKLEDDYSGQEPVLVDNLQGHYQFDGVKAHYGALPALIVPQLAIRPGEHIGVIGPVGAGKTTLLRLLSGMYKPQEGRILLDNIDLHHLAKPLLAEHIGYLQQEGRLFAGTLRENLLLGVIDPGDAVILEAAQRTGLMESLLASHPKGLQQEIYEGGIGLSGGQRQLVNLTRVLLRKPHIWLLDEPTASVDGQIEQKLIALFQQTITARDTLILVTHKPDMLRLVDRLIVIANHQILLDGPRDQVLARLQANSAAPAIGRSA